MKRFKYRIVPLLALLFISACSTTHEQDGGGEIPSSAQGGKRSGDNTTSSYPGGSALGMTELQGIDAEGNALGGAFDDPRSPLSKQTIYFEFDSSQVRQEFMPVIYAHAAYLAAHPEQRIILQGHADERGSREYNIALGEQRSKSVARIMQMHGVTGRQLQVVSYGEEKPAVFGHDKSAWELNRRVEIIYLEQ